MRERKQRQRQSNSSKETRRLVLMALLENENVNHQKRILSHVHLYSFNQQHQHHNQRQQQRCGRISRDSSKYRLNFFCPLAFLCGNFTFRFVLDPFLCAIASHKNKFMHCLFFCCWWVHLLSPIGLLLSYRNELMTKLGLLIPSNTLSTLRFIPRIQVTQSLWNFKEKCKCFNCGWIFQHSLHFQPKTSRRHLK